MRRLVLLMVGAGEEDRGQPVEGDHAIGLRIVDGHGLVGLHQMRVIGRVVEGPGRAAAQHIGVDCGAQQPAPHTQVEGGADVAHLLQLRPDPALLDLVAVGGELARDIACQGVEGRLGGQHPGLHRGMAALDLGDVEKARGAADERTARKGQLGDRLEAAFVDRPRPIGDAPAALEGRPDGRMGLEALELLEGIEPGIGVVEADDETDGHLIVLDMIEEGAAIGVAAQRPAHGMDDLAGYVLGRIDLPQLLDPDAIGLGIDALPQIEAMDQGLGERASATLGEQGQPSVQLDARREIPRRLAVLAHAHLAGRNTLHPAGLVIEHLRRGEARIDLHPQPLGLLGEPAAEIAQADDVIALVVHLGRRRQAERALLRQQQEIVVDRRRVEGRSLLPPVGDQLIEGNGLEDRAGEDMGADLGSLLDDADRGLAPRGGGELLQADRRRQAGGAAADDHHVIAHRFPFHGALPVFDPRRQPQFLQPAA